MGIDNLDRIFRPKTIAVVGAGERKRSIGFALLRNLIDGKYPGKIFPINPHRKTVCKLTAYLSLREIQSPIDLAIIIEPVETALQYVRECAELQAGGVVIITPVKTDSGLEETIIKEADGSGLRIIGPNRMGLFCSHSNLNANLSSRMPLPGKMAFLSQSGAICMAIQDFSIREHIGFSHIVDLGSMVDVNFSDMIDYLGGDSRVSSILMYIENLTHLRSFMSAARAVSRIKPIIALKAGRTEAGAEAAALHTGALTGEDAFYDAAFKRAGIVRVKMFEELFDCAELLSKAPRLKGPGLAIITNAGGPGVTAADSLSDYGMKLAPLTVNTIEKLNSILPIGWSGANPIDMTREASPEHYLAAAKVCMEADEVNSLLIMFTPYIAIDSADVAKALAPFFQKTSYPVFTSWLGGQKVEKGRLIFKKAGIPTFNSPERAVRAFVDLYSYARNIEMLQEIPLNLPKKLEFDQKKARRLIQNRLKAGRFLLSEIEAKTLFSAYGIPVNQTESAATDDEAVEKAKYIGFPVVMKIDSIDILNKTDAGGVKLNLGNASDVRMAFRKIMESAWSYNPVAEIEGVTIQSMLDRPGLELIVGAKNDRDFGPVILFGLGGIMTDILHDHAFALPPLNRLLARRLMEQTRVFQVLNGNQILAPASLVILEEILIRLSQLVTDFPEIEKLEINPLIVTRSDAVAVDAKALLKPSHVKAPLHLIISPYPDQYEAHTVDKAGEKLFIRPIRPEDAPLLTELFESLSPRSIRLRFFTPLKHLSSKMLARFTQIDYDREIALVALRGSGSDEKILGVARIIVGDGVKEAEFAIMVGDPWQGTGIGAELLHRCLSIARERHIKIVSATVLEENTQMLALGRKLGFYIKRTLGSQEYELKLSLDR